jgi:hypothetical protein
MSSRYEVGDVVSGSNLTENFKGQDITAAPRRRTRTGKAQSPGQHKSAAA